MNNEYVYNLLDELVAAKGDDEIKIILREIEISHTTSDFSAPPLSHEILYRCRKLYAEMLFDKEIKSASSFLNEPENHPFYKWGDYQRRAVYECGMASILLERAISSVAYIGSGAFPATAIIAARNGIKVTLIDRSEEALSLAYLVASKCNIICNRILTDAENIQNLREIDMAVISGTVGVDPDKKLELCKHVLSAIGEDGLLCLRSPVREENVLMTPIPSISEAYRADSYIETGMDYMHRVYLSKHHDTMKGWV